MRLGREFEEMKPPLRKIKVLHLVLRTAITLAAISVGQKIKKDECCNNFCLRTFLEQ